MALIEKSEGNARAQSFNEDGEAGVLISVDDADPLFEETSALLSVDDAQKLMIEIGAAIDALNAI